MKTYSSKPAIGETLENVVCDFCGGKDRIPYLPCEGFSFVKCADCGLIYQNPRPAGMTVLGRYEEDYFKYELENEDNFFNLMLLGLKDARFPDIEREVFAPEGEGRRTGLFLDIGCATGKLLEHARGRGWREQGVEVCRPSVEYARTKRNIRIFLGTLEQAAFPAETFSVIHGSHVIEHVPSPRAFIREIYRILRPGGYALLTTPNVDGWQAGFFRQRWRSAIADHLYLFSKRCLRKFFKNEGFAVEIVKTWGGLAAGMGPKFLKRILDKAAKLFGAGDVMMFRLRKRPLTRGELPSDLRH